MNADKRGFKPRIAGELWGGIDLLTFVSLAVLAFSDPRLSAFIRG